ncbi:MAG: hypothetical protein ACRD3O_10815, partial [Terriglobia bacterium]
SEGLIRQLKSKGIEVFHTHLYKGFGMAAEMPEMEDAKRAAAIAHDYGMKVDTYIQRRHPTRGAWSRFSGGESR